MDMYLLKEQLSNFPIMVRNFKPVPVAEQCGGIVKKTGLVCQMRGNEKYGGKCYHHRVKDDVDVKERKEYKDEDRCQGIQKSNLQRCPNKKKDGNFCGRHSKTKTKKAPVDENVNIDMKKLCMNDDGTLYTLRDMFRLVQYVVGDYNIDCDEMEKKMVEGVDLLKERVERKKERAEKKRAKAEKKLNQKKTEDEKTEDEKTEDEDDIPIAKLRRKMKEETIGEKMQDKDDMKLIKHMNKTKETCCVVSKTNKPCTQKVQGVDDDGRSVCEKHMTKEVGSNTKMSKDEIEKRKQMTQTRHTKPTIKRKKKVTMSTKML